MTIRLAETLGQALQIKGLTITTAESCTGGSVATAITDVAGSSQWFQMGVVAYSNTVKSQILKVCEETILKHGAVSEDVVREMLLGALSLSKASMGVAVSGVAGPTGGSVHKPVGTVCISWGNTQTQYSNTYLFPGDRAQVRLAAVRQCLIVSSQFLKDIS